MPNYQVTRAIRNAIVSDCQNGMTIDDLVKKHKVPLAMINKIISCVKPKKLSHPERAKRRLEIVQAFNCGMKIDEIAKKFSVSKEYVKHLAIPRMSRKDRSVRRSKIANDYIQGVPIDEICKRHSVCKGTVKDTMPQLSHEQRASRRKAIADEYNAGASVDELCAKYHVTKVTVHSAVIESGRKVNRVLSQYPRKDKPNRTLEIVRRMLDGERGSDIAKDMGVSNQYVSQVRIAAINSGFKFSKNDDDL